MTRTVLGIAIACLGLVRILHAASGDVDLAFNTQPGLDKSVFCATTQADGKIIIGGAFTTISGVARNRIARLNADGTLDTTFDPGKGANDFIYSASSQPDGKVVVGGLFTTFNGTNRNRIVRLNADGSLDVTFDPGNGASGEAPHVTSVAVQKDGKVLLGGFFTFINGVGQNRVARLNADGSLDYTLDCGMGANSYVFCVALQEDGKALVGGAFTTFNRTNQNCVARLNADGSLDSTFKPRVGANSDIRSLVIQPDGRVLIGGFFTNVNGLSKNCIARLNTDGSIDSSFNPGAGANSSVYAMIVQTNGKVLIGGAFTSIDGTNRNRIARLNANGSLDDTFNPGTGANNYVDGLAVQVDGKVLVGGAFTTFNEEPRPYVVRLLGDSISALPIPLNVQYAGNQVVLNWANPAFSLQSASFVTGAYSNVLSATSPYTNSITGSQQYFRLKAN